MEPRSESLKAFNALRLDSTAEYFVDVRDAEQLRDALAWARENRVAVSVLGGGTNVLLWPQVEGLVLRINTSGVEVIEDDGRYVTLRVAAGENWHALVAWCNRMGYHGLANLAWIPGSVGAVPVQNVGAYGVEVDQFITAVHTLNKSTGEVRELSPSECAFGYRDSVFKRAAGREFLITGVDFRLDRNAQVNADYPALQRELGEGPLSHQRVFEAVVALRKRRLPDHREAPNVGSFFKNPSVSWIDAEIFSMRWPDLPQFAAGEGKIKLSAAWMIDHLGWRGIERDDVGVDADHALVLVNRGGADAGAFIALADEIITQVRETFDVTLEREPRLIGVGGTG